MATATMAHLRDQVRGEILIPEDPGYDDARRVYNAMIDRRPRVIVRCAGVDDVVAAVNFAREGGLSIAVRGGSHSVPGFGTADDAVVIDLVRMQGVEVDPERKTADRQGEPFMAFVSCWAGPLEEGEAALKPIRDVAPVVAEHVGPMPYPALNSAFDALVPPGLQHYWKANFVKELTDDAIAAHLEHWPKVPTVNSTVHIYPINGACHRVAPDATAFAYRDATFATVIAGMWPDPADNDANTAWVRDSTTRPRPTRRPAATSMSWPATTRSGSRTTTRANYDRLVDVKRKLDPDNLFHHNQNIRP